MRKLLTGIIGGIMCLLSFGATTMDEASNLNSYFRKSEAEISKKLDEYEQKVKADPNDTYSQFAVGMLYLAQAIAEPPVKNASYKAKEIMDKVLDKEKDNYTLISYAGFAHSLIARDDGNPIVKTLEVGKSSELFDKSVKLAKGKDNEWLIRLNRANSYINFPDFFGKRKTAEDDFRFIDAYESSNNQKVPQEVMIDVYFFVGEIEKGNGKIDSAIPYWKKSVNLDKKLNSNNPNAKRAKKQLDVFED